MKNARLLIGAMAEMSMTTLVLGVVPAGRTSSGSSARIWQGGQGYGILNNGF